MSDAAVEKTLSPDAPPTKPIQEPAVDEQDGGLEDDEEGWHTVEESESEQEAPGDSSPLPPRYVYI